MASLPKRLTSLAMVSALSGSPAVLSACMALCLPGMATAASDEGSTAPGRAAHMPVAIPVVGSEHAHHGSPRSNVPDDATAHRASSPESSAVRLSATCSDCCADGQVMLAAGPGVARTDAKSLGAAPLASPVASFFLTTSELGASPPGPPVPPPSPTRVPLVLRI